MNLSPPEILQRPAPQPEAPLFGAPRPARCDTSRAPANPGGPPNVSDSGRSPHPPGLLCHVRRPPQGSIGPPPAGGPPLDRGDEARLGAVAWPPPHVQWPWRAGRRNRGLRWPGFSASSGAESRCTARPTHLAAGVIKCQRPRRAARRCRGRPAGGFKSPHPCLERGRNFGVR